MPSSAATVANKSPIVLGFAGDLSGTTAFLDGPYLAGLQTRFYQVNHAGGVKGHPISLDVVDQTDTLAQAQSSFRQLVGSKAVGVIAGGLQTNVFTFIPIADQSHIALTYYSMTPQTDGNPYFFGTESPSNRMGTAQATFLVNTLKAEGIKSPKIAILGWESPWLATAKTELKKLGATIVADEEVPLSSPDPTPDATTVAASKPDAIVAGILDPYVQSTVSALKANGFDGPIINEADTAYTSLTAANDPNFYTLAQSVPVEFANYPGMASIRKTAAAAGQTKNMTGATFINGYMAGLLFTDALQKCGGTSCTRVQFAKSLGEVQVTASESGGISSPLGPSGSVHQLMDGVAIAHVVNGKFTFAVGFKSYGVKN